MAFEDVSFIAWMLVLLGFIIGTLSDFFGIGGAFIMTPAPNILGFPIIYAIGTDLALMLGSSIIATFRHFELKGSKGFLIDQLIKLRHIHPPQHPTPTKTHFPNSLSD